MYIIKIFVLQGLGRNFLRHLRRTRLLVHVVDAAAEDPLNDYKTVKEVIFFSLCRVFFFLFCFFFFPHNNFCILLDLMSYVLCLRIYDEKIITL